jgi:flagellar biosynthesis protein FlhA
VPKLVAELIPKVLPMAVVHRLLSALLGEGVPIRDLRTIFAALIEGAATTQDPLALLELVRAKLGGFIVQHVFGAVGELRVMALEADLERLLQDVLRLSAASGAFGIEPGLAGEVRQAAAQAATRLEAAAAAAGLVTRPELREPVARLLRGVRPPIRVLSYQEIPADKRIRVVELIGRPGGGHD